MLAMLRLRRRQPVLLVFALIITILVFRYSYTSSWDGDKKTATLDLPAKPQGASVLGPELPKSPPPKAQDETLKEAEKPKGVEKPKTTEPALPIETETSMLPSPAQETNKGSVETDTQQVALPAKQTPAATKTGIHWEKQKENFPVPTESIIQLPTGSPVAIPRIQHEFKEETSDAKVLREKRQAEVKEEFKKAWTGYRKQAWLHDELSPVSGNFRNPFSGWAATLVDSLDTLWIMGFKEEFEEAAEAVDQIDFTTSTRNDIQVFETTIRYLGGLVGAYDVSGHKYKNLLDKAVELADILIGAFDTPNRMPILFYQWQPEYASQPHRASIRSNLAELGSLSVEFTRLAQLTNEPRYYDAVARVTDALAEFQNRTKLPGVFPPSVDATGCNNTVDVTPEPSSKEQPEGYKPISPNTAKDASPKEEKETVTPENSKEDSKATESPKNPVRRSPADLSEAKEIIGKSLGDWDCKKQGLETSVLAGADRFSMGGNQDSTYEYFPKEYLLLGGRVDTYRELYLNSMKAVRENMLFRPMVPGGKDILVAGSVTADGKPGSAITLTAETEHLTCFIGGMFGMGSKIFDIKGDLEIAKKLTDGCVWAYGSMPAEIMAESATLMPCDSMEKCAWNETAYYSYLDPQGADRDRQVEEFLAAEAAEGLVETTKEKDGAAETQTGSEKAKDDSSDASEKAAEAEALLEAAKAKGDSKEDSQKTAEAEALVEAAKAKDEKDHKAEIEPEKPKDDSTDASEKTTEAEALVEAAKAKDEKDHKAQIGPEKPKDDSTDASEKTAEAEALVEAAKAKDEKDHKTQTGSEKPKGDSSETSEKPSATVEKRVPPQRLVSVVQQKPLSHKEYVESQIKLNKLPPGYVTIRGKSYILRPEAIESVWYMYRITGDPAWQTKGWKMFEAVIKATSAKYGHSAIQDVTSDEPMHTDQMESFWLAETLKYFYLLFSTPDTISLDDWVLNTEAHPFKREA